MHEELSCDATGLCKALEGSKVITNCIYCGKELIEKDGKWYTWDADFHTDDPVVQDYVH